MCENGIHPFPFSLRERSTRAGSCGSSLLLMRNFIASRVHCVCGPCSGWPAGNGTARDAGKAGGQDIFIALYLSGRWVCVMLSYAVSFRCVRLYGVKSVTKHKRPELKDVQMNTND